MPPKYQGKIEVDIRDSTPALGALPGAQGG